MPADGLTASIDKMRRDGVADAAIDTFRHYFERLVAGETGLLPEDEIEPVESLPDAEALPEADASEALGQAVVVKLNGGLGTSMGMTGPKSLLEVKDGATFLDVIARQVLALRRRTGARVPLLLMNSFATRDASSAALERHRSLAVDGVPADFVQNKQPKVLVDGLQPAEWPADPALEWCPPGHGDLYTALLSTGTLDCLLERGYRYAFVSNSDNLGAVLDTRILAWFAREELPFLMEVADRTEADRKGGHLARRRGGRLVLREIAQAPEDDLDAFQDVSRHRYFNANNLWIDLRALAELLSQRGGVLGLPMIVNRKTVDPTDRSSPAVLQLETAMGAAIDVFPGAQAIRVPRRRFIPVKTTNDLVVLRSDAYVLTGDAEVAPAPARRGRGAPLVDLDPEHFKLVSQLDERFPGGPPSLVECDRLTVEGEVSFGGGVVVRGEVHLRGPRRIEDGAVLEG